MKKYVTIALFIFWAAVVSLLVAGLVFYQDRAGRPSQAGSGSPAQNLKQNLSGLALSAAEVAKHNTAGDCWMIISGKVYDFTAYENIHPGGMREIVQVCGADGTTLFQTKDSRGVDHSAYAYSLLADYYLGDLGQTMAAAGNNSATTPTAGNPAIPAQVAPTLPVAETKTQMKIVTAAFLSAAEVAKHSTAADCWMIISGKVYNLTSYEKLHPGGMAQIVQACGRDGSSLYATKGGGGSSHSNYADSLLADYYVGDIGKTPSKPASVSPAKLAAGTPKTPVAPTPAPAPSSGQTTGATVSLTAAEVAKHNTAADCWMIINGNVYDLTSYERIHPGGMAQIVQACGRDGSSLYATKGGGGGSHSNYADSQLAGYLVGTLGGQTTTTQIQQAQQQAASTSQNQPQSDRDNEEEDDD